MLISCNKIKELPENVSKLVNLVSLNISHNSIKSLPMSISSLCKLKKLDVSSNDLHFQSSVAAIVTLTNLRSLKVCFHFFQPLIHKSA